MKFLMILIFFISSKSLYASEDNDSLKYMLAYRFIVEDSNYIQKVFSEDIDGMINLCLSEEIVYIPKAFFIYDMIEYEYSCLDKNQKKNLFKEMFKSDMLDSFSTYINPDLRDIIKKPKCNLKVFFSKIIENKLMATILQANISDEYSEAFEVGYTVLYYLFYFENDKIKMSMKQYYYR